MPRAQRAASSSSLTAPLPSQTGEVLLMGGRDHVGNVYRDVWRSTDGGVTWSLVAAEAPWPPRAGHTAVVLQVRCP